MTILAGGMALHGIVQDLLQAIEAELPDALAQRQVPRRQSLVTSPSTELSQTSVGWQGRAAAAVVALTEVIFGASPAWQAMSARAVTKPAADGSSSSSGSDSNTGSSVTPHDFAHTRSREAATGETHIANGVRQVSNDQNSAAMQQQHQQHQQRQQKQQQQDTDVSQFLALERMIEQAIDVFSSAGVWQLPTHLDPDAANTDDAILTPQVIYHSAFLKTKLHLCSGILSSPQDVFAQKYQESTVQLCLQTMPFCTV